MTGKIASGASFDLSNQPRVSEHCIMAYSKFVPRVYHYSNPRWQLDSGMFEFHKRTRFFKSFAQFRDLPKAGKYSAEIICRSA